VDSVGSAAFGGPTQRRHIPGIGSSIVPPFVAIASFDDVVLVPERDAVAGCRELFTRHGILAGGSTGSVYAAISRYLPRRLPHRPAVAFLCADNGAPYIDTVYGQQWCARVFGEPVTAEVVGRGESR
jgi:cysteine synthase